MPRDPYPDIRRQVDFRQRGPSRIGSRRQPEDVAGLIQAREADVHRLPPNRAVDRARLHAVERGHHPLVLRGIEWLIGLDVRVPLAVAVDVEDQRRPSLRLHFVAGPLVHLRVQPADNAAVRVTGAGPERVVRVLGKIQMLRGEAGVDERPLGSLRVVHRELTRRNLERRRLRRRMVRARFTESRVLRRPDPGCEPHAPLFVEHGVVNAGVAVPDRLVAPRRTSRGIGRGSVLGSR